MKMVAKKALFLDRDGVINIDYGYVYRASNCDFVSGIFELVLTAKKKGYFVVVVTNQSGIGRGYYSEADFHHFMTWMNHQFNHALDAVYFCPDHPTHGIGQYKKNSFDRKPNPGMLLRSMKDHHLDPQQSLMVGDSEKDMLAASLAGIKTRLLLSQNQVNFQCINIHSLEEALKYL